MDTASVPVVAETTPTVTDSTTTVTDPTITVTDPTTTVTDPTTTVTDPTTIVTDPTTTVADPNNTVAMPIAAATTTGAATPAMASANGAATAAASEAGPAAAPATDVREAAAASAPSDAAQTASVDTAAAAAAANGTAAVAAADAAAAPPATEADTAEAGPALGPPLRPPVSTEGMVGFLETEDGEVEDPWTPIEGYEGHFIDLRKLFIGQKFATGTYGQLFRGVYDGLGVAVKVLKQPAFEAEADAANGQDMQHQCRQEVDMLSRLRHPNVLSLVGACQRPPQWCIITEYMSGGDLRGLLNKQEGRPLPLADALHLSLEIARGMHYLHEMGIVHRDLKPDNLLLSADRRTVVVSDFGVSRIEASAVMTAETGTYRWMAPEMIDHRPYTRKVDVYSFGVVLWELYTMQLPFSGMSAVQAAFAVVNKGARPPVPGACPAPLAELIQACWHCDPDQRPPFSAVVTRLEDMVASLKADPEAFLGHVVGGGDVERGLGPAAGSGRGGGLGASLSSGSDKGGGGGVARGGAAAAARKKGGRGFLCCFGGPN